MNKITERSAYSYAIEALEILSMSHESVGPIDAARRVVDMYNLNREQMQPKIIRELYNLIQGG